MAEETKVYKVQAPDGSIIKIEGPIGADPKEIEAFAEQQFNAKNAPPKPEARPSELTPEDVALAKEHPTFTKMSYGMIEPLIGAAQLSTKAFAQLAGLIGADEAKKAVEEYANTIGLRAKQTYEATRQPEDKSFDFTKLAGAVANPLNLLGGPELAGMKMLEKSPVMQSALPGVVGGATTPVENPEQNFSLSRSVSNVSNKNNSGG